MNAFAIAEGMDIPDKKDNKVMVCIYHSIFENFYMNNDLIFHIADISDII